MVEAAINSLESQAKQAKLYQEQQRLGRLAAPVQTLPLMLTNTVSSNSNNHGSDQENVSAIQSPVRDQIKINSPKISDEKEKSPQRKIVSNSLITSELKNSH